MKTLKVLFVTLGLVGACEPASKPIPITRAPAPVRQPQPIPAPPAAEPSPRAAVVVTPPAPIVAKVPPRGGQETLAEARRLLAAGEMQDALKLARRACKLVPSSFLAWNTLGRAELENDHGAEAQVAFERALELSPDSSYAHNNLGLVHLLAGRWTDALEELEAATAHGEAPPFMWNNLGIALEHLDRVEEARAAYQKAADGGAANAQKSVTRLFGVKSIRTASR
jgi:tetratricopeptide (TPR) repeat protein